MEKYMVLMGTKIAFKLQKSAQPNSPPPASGREQWKTLASITIANNMLFISYL
jgi:hypothetical protein